MFKNIKIATGLNALMIVFVLFLAIISLFNFNSANRFDKELKDSISIATSDNELQDAAALLNNAVGMVVAENLALSKMNNVALDKKLLEEIDTLVGQASQSYRRFLNQPQLSAAEHEQRLRVCKAFDNLMTFTLRHKEALTKPAQNSFSLVEQGKEVSDLRTALKTHIDQYDAVLSTILTDHQQQADSKNRQMMVLAFFILAASMAMVVVIRLWLKRSLFQRLNQTREAFAVLASGDLSQPVDIGAANEIGEMLAELEKMRLSLIATVSDIRQGVTSIYGSAQEIATSNNDLSSRTEQQASALQQTAASMEELKITVRQNADNAHSARQLVESASGSARKGGEVMVNLDGIMREITENSRQIADINGVIDSIANQTNILALNAAVEAARAGEQGRGFAVVAGEVRNLAKRSADAAKEIRQLINVCVSNMNTGSQEVELAGAAMQEVVKSVTQVTDIMSEITSASDEQSTGINQIAQAVNEMDLVTQQNASMVEQAANVARFVEEQAHHLERSVSQFSLQAGASPMEKPQKTSPLAAKGARQSEPARAKNKADAEADWVSF
ncbi:methyl-accepting chemotaxis protein [Pantoea latae]|uniref:Methyl-accepting chemotaxis protein n=1 Tax=Pantoea latae TaxID=1964541 RepID=A0A1V9DNI7_9GAMM|nr:methyl-accepting chemotaxis protein [Pantoea latae]OQP35418.1 hypothetical protein B2J69_05340 [Pantoea latae]